MIKIKTLAQEGAYEVHVSGEVTDADYKDVLILALDRAIEQDDRIRVIVIFSSDVRYSVGALFDDAAFGFGHWTGFDRLCVVTDEGWIRTGIKAVGWIMPGAVEVFPLGQEDDARRWLQESLGTIHQTDLGGGILHVQLRGKLDPAAYTEEERDLMAFLDRTETPRLLLDLREFDGWQSLSAIPKHLALVRDVYQAWDRVAMISDKSWQKLGERILDKLRGPTEFFGPDQEDAAMTWLKG